MALNPKNWTINTYTPSAWTTLVDAATETLVKNVVVAAGATAPTVAVRVINRFGDLAQTIVPNEVLDPNRGYRLDLDLIVLEKFQKLQVRADVAGVSFSAAGIEKGTGIWASAAVRIPAITSTGVAGMPNFTGTPSITPITASGSATVTP